MAPPVAALVAEAVDLDLSPAREGYTGVATLSLAAAHRSTVPVVHARGLQLVEVALDGVPARFTHVGDELRVAGVVGPGEHVLTVRFAGALRATPHGLFRYPADGRWYVASDFEPVDARAAWPCVDDPAVKVPWTLVVRGLPPGDVALSNTRAVVGDGVTSFPPTPPLPAYAVGLMAGPYVGRPVEGLPRPATVWTVTGHEALADELVAELPAVYTAVAAGLPEPPWPLLDWVILPDLAAAAMENPGVTTLSERAVTFGFTREVAAHELAHLWFGDWVTPRTWEDLWLSEGFADFLASTRLGTADPARVGRDAAWSEALGHAPALRPGAHGWRFADHPPMYDKAAVVLHTAHGLLGDDAFRGALAGWASTWGGASPGTSDWLATLPEAVRAEVEPLVYGVGAPRVHLEPVADGVRLTRSPFLRLGQRGPPRALGAPTAVTLSIRSPTLGHRSVEVAVGDGAVVVPLAEGEVPLPTGGGWSTWSASGPLLASLLRGPERTAALPMVAMMVDAGVTPLDEVLAEAPVWTDLPAELAQWRDLWMRLDVGHAAGDPALVTAAHERLRGTLSRLCAGPAGSEACNAALVHLGARALPGDEAWGAVRSGLAVDPWSWEPVRRLATEGAPGLAAELEAVLARPADPRVHHLAAQAWALSREPGAPRAAVRWALDPRHPRPLAHTLWWTLGTRDEEPVRDELLEELVAAWPTAADTFTPDERVELARLAGGCSVARVQRVRDTLGSRMPELSPALDLWADEAAACTAERGLLQAAARRMLALP